MTTRRQLIVGAGVPFVAAFTIAAGGKRSPLLVTYYFLPG
jgi:hypothetical protein